MNSGEFHRNFIKKNIDSIISFEYWGLCLSCTESDFNFWKTKTPWYRRMYYALLVKFDLISGKCWYENINGKKCLIYKDSKYARL